MIFKLVFCMRAGTCFTAFERGNSPLTFSHCFLYYQYTYIQPTLLLEQLYNSCLKAVYEMTMMWRREGSVTINTSQFFFLKVRGYIL